MNYLSKSDRGQDPYRDILESRTAEQTREISEAVKKLSEEFRGNDDYAEYVNKCPLCGGDLFVTFYQAYVWSPLSTDGFSFMGSRHTETDNEVVTCHACNFDFLLEELSIYSDDTEETEGG